MMQAPAPTVPLTTTELEALTRSLGSYAAQLAELITAETAQLHTTRVPGPPALQQEKARLSAVYGETCAAVKANQAGFAALPAALKEGVRLQLQSLAAATEENARALRMAQSATERVVSIVVRAVREQRTLAAGYTRSSAPPRRIPGGLGLALDRSY
jgi:hypothetical protein